jgi:hypothetical protein
MLGLLESVTTAYLATLDEKRLLEISRKLIEARKRKELSDTSFNYIAGLIFSQWANKKLQPALGKLDKSFDELLAMANNSTK